MKKAVILVGGKQYLVEEKETLRVDLLPAGTKELELDALLVTDGDKTEVGTPTVKGVKVSAKVVTPETKGDKIRVIRYKAKKRVHKETGHRQKYTEIEITKIAQWPEFSKMCPKGHKDLARAARSVPEGHAFENSGQLCFFML